MENEMPTNEQLLEQLEKLSATKVIQYVVPTIPLGQEWVIGIKGNIVKLTTQEEVTSFLAGVTAATDWFVEHVPAVREALR